jgi:predicted ATPase/class 3 adenylate cyclase
MLFSDIEGSTALLSRVGGRYAEVLSAQRALLRAAFDTGGGQELGTEGDSFFVVFESASDAVRCCVAAQRALAGYDWPGGDPVRVRMGLHSGEPARHEDGYVGIDVHRAARIAAAAHGGQVVLSDPTRQLAEAGLPPGVSVRDLGWHRLKDIEAPEHLYQLVGAGLHEQFPPLKSLGAPTSLPAPPTALVGRDSELEQLRAVIMSPGNRLVTLTGTGGVGKTRLALAAASSLEEFFPHGVFFVPLAAVSNAEVMWKTIADRLDVGDDRSAADAVVHHLRTGRSLLVLDNLEQLHEAAGAVAELLVTAPPLVVLATSRRALHVQGEQEWPVPPLEVPAQPDAAYAEVQTFSAVRLFIQQAMMVRPDFTLTPGNAADVAAICRRLDGLPLAIELAAARVKLLAPQAILARLGQSLNLAAGDAGRPSRQQTLRNTIAWSYDLLAADLQGIYQRTGVFEGGCDLDAFAAVALAGYGQEYSADPLRWAGELLDLSLITVTEGINGEPRIRMLETIRQHALERLEHDGDPDAVHRRHAEYYAAFAEQACDRLQERAQWAWLDRLEIEHDNLRAALSWSLDDRPPVAAADGRAAMGLRLVQSLAPFWYQHGHTKEGRRWLENAIEVASSDSGVPLAQVGHWLGVLRQQQGEDGAAIPLFERSLAIWRELGDRNQMAVQLNSLGITWRSLGDLGAARSFFEDSIALARQTASDVRLATALGNLGILEIDAGNVDRATEVLQEALVLNQKTGQMWGAAIVQNSLAAAHLLAGDAEEAHRLLLSVLDDVVGSGDPELIATTLELAAGIAAHIGDGPPAARLAGAAEAIRDKAGIPITKSDAAMLERFLAPARAATEPAEWDRGLIAGHALTQDEAVALISHPLKTGHTPDPGVSLPDRSQRADRIGGRTRLRPRAAEQEAEPPPVTADRLQ